MNNYPSSQKDDGVAYDHIMIYKGKDSNGKDNIIHAGGSGTNVIKWNEERGSYNNWAQNQGAGTNYQVKWLRLDHEKLKQYDSNYLKLQEMKKWEQMPW